MRKIKNIISIIMLIVKGSLKIEKTGSIILIPPRSGRTGMTRM